MIKRLFASYAMLIRLKKAEQLSMAANIQTHYYLW